MVLVYGADGLLGSKICQRLRAQGRPVRALLPRKTSPASIDALKKLGVDLFVADVCEPAAVAAACREVEAVICADPALMPARNGPPLDGPGMRCLVQFTNAVGAGRFVFVTVPERFATRCALVVARDEGRSRLESHNMDYAILETGFFMEAWLSPELGFDYWGGSATIYGDGAQPVPWVSCDDVAAFAVYSLNVDHRTRHRFQLVAETVSPFDLLRTFEELRGQQIDVSQIAASQLKAEYDRAADAGERAYAAMKIEYAHGLHMRPDNRDHPIHFSSVWDYARRFAGAQPAAVQHGA